MKKKIRFVTALDPIKFHKEIKTEITPYVRTNCYVTSSYKYHEKIDKIDTKTKTYIQREVLQLFFII